MSSDITAVILAGGLGTRMGGQDKGLLLYQGQAMITHVINALKTQVHQIIINANRHQSDYHAYGYRVIQDELADFQGPLAGMQAGLTHCTSALCLFVPCDTPNLPQNLVNKLAQALQEHGVDIAIARSQRIYPVICLMKVSCLASLTDFLASGQRKVLDWQTSLPHCIVDFDSQSGDFDNYNNPQQWSA